MKIYIIPIKDKFQPQKSHIIYPKHNNDFGVEQDFYKFIKKNKKYLTTNLEEANFHYLPIFWTNWHLTHNYAKTGSEELQDEVSKVLIDEQKTFTICQYDDGPLVNIGKTLLFLASRKTQDGIDIPLLCKKHRKPFFKPHKKYLASFLGRLETFPIRKEMYEILKNDNNIFVSDGNYGSSFFVQKTLESYISLTPRGYGGSSFRLFEAMQLGVVPFLIGDIDTRPFKKFIDWKSCSFYTEDPKKIPEMLAGTNKETLLLMGKKCKEIYDTILSYQNWCPFVIKELESVNNLIKYE